MRRHRQRQALRQAGAGLSREIDIPLPTGGILSESRTAEISGMYAAELENWRSNGASIVLREQSTVDRAGPDVIERVPFEFGTEPLYIDARENAYVAGNAGFSIFDATLEELSVSYISSNAILLSRGAPPILFTGQFFRESNMETNTDVFVSEFYGGIAHKDRFFAWRDGDLDFYYGGIGEIDGTLTRFPLSRLGNITGKIIAMRSLTLDASEDINDVLAIFTSTGQIIIYEGLDPSDASDWRQSARVLASPPVSRDSFVQVGSDLWMLTDAGVVSVLDTIRQSRLALLDNVSRPIQETIVEQLKEGGDWSLHFSADALRVIVNRVFEGVSSQFIYRTETRSWSTANYPAIRWHNLNRKTQFTAGDGSLRTLGGEGELITARWVSGWFRLPRAGGIAYLLPTILARGPLTVTATVLTDHDETLGDRLEAAQTVTQLPDDPADPGGRVSINEEIATDAVGSVFQLQLEVTAAWAEIVSLKAAIM